MGRELDLTRTGVLQASVPKNEARASGICLRSL